MAAAGVLAFGGMMPLRVFGKGIGRGTDGLAVAGCFRTSDGKDHFAAFAADGRLGAKLALPGRGHGMALCPRGEKVVVFARRPGTFALVVDIASNGVDHRIDSVAGHHFQGHGVFSPDGRYLFAVENHYTKGRGVVGIHDAADGYRRVGELDGFGIGTHDLAMMADGRTLALANGGILTHPDSGRAKLNLATMRPSLAYVEVASGKLMGEYRLDPDLHQLSIRHMAANADGTVVLAFQYEGAKTRLVPLVGVHAGEAAITLLSAPDAVTAHMRHYCGSVAFEPTGRYVAVTAPRGNVATFWDARARRYVGALELADVCGVSGAEKGGNGFLLSSGAGGVVECRVGGQGQGAHATPLIADWLDRVKWDNHLLALGSGRG